MSLDFNLYYDVDHKGDLDGDELYEGKYFVLDANITHNLNKMAEAAGLYEWLWRPEEQGAVAACQLSPHLLEGVFWLEANPDAAKEHEPDNGWGSYDGLLSFARRVMAACATYPNAKIEVNR